MNYKGEIWKQTESQRGTHIKAGIPHETNMKKGKERNNMNQNTDGSKTTKHTLEKLFIQDSHGQQVGHHEFRYFLPGTDLGPRTHDLGCGHLRI